MKTVLVIVLTFSLAATSLAAPWRKLVENPSDLVDDVDLGGDFDGTNDAQIVGPVQSIGDFAGSARLNCCWINRQ